MPDVDHIADAMHRETSRKRTAALKSQRDAAAATTADLRQKLAGLVARALAEFPHTRAAEIVPYRVVKPRFILFSREETRAAWSIGGLYRPESSRRRAGDIPVLLLSSGEIVWQASSGAEAPRGLQSIVGNNDLRRLCRSLERLLDSRSAPQGSVAEARRSVDQSVAVAAPPVQSERTKGPPNPGFILPNRGDSRTPSRTTHLERVVRVGWVSPDEAANLAPDGSVGDAVWQQIRGLDNDEIG